ncbi:hypothetical protein D3C76_1107530 [compost metagenome]
MLDFAVGIEHLGNAQVFVAGVFIQCGHRYGQHLAGAAGNEKHLGGHFRHQGVIGVVHVQQHGVQHHFACRACAAGTGRAATTLAGLVQGLGGDRQDLAYSTGPAALAARQGCEIGRHARFDMTDVGFRYLCPDGHRRQFGDAQDQGCLLLGVEGLAFARIHGDYGPGHRCIDTRVAKFGLIAAQAGLGLADLRAVHVDAGLGNFQLSLGALHIFLAGGAAGGQVALAFVLLFGELVLGVLFSQLGLEVVDREAPGIESGLLGRGVDFDQQLPRLDLVADLHMQFADLP